MEKVFSFFVLVLGVSLALPAAAQNSPNAVFTNSTAISIPASGNGTPYPSAITVSGLTGNVASTPGSVKVTLNGMSHTFPDDVGIVLVGPTGAAILLMDGAGDAPDLVNVTFTLSDDGATVLPDLTAWGAGTFKPTNYVSPLDSFPTPGPGTAYGDPGATGAGATFSSVFGGTNPNGTWNLFVRDFVTGDSGSIAGGWTLEVNTSGGGPAAPDAQLDYNGDGKSDYSIVRPAGPLPTDTVTWFNFWNGIGPQSTVTWGIQSDEFVPADYDGDGKDDIAVFRAGSPATWYIINSNGNTLRVETFGQTGDDPSIVADYNGDNKDDIAVYRINPTPGGTNTWFNKPQGAPFVAVTFGTNSGAGGDFPAPGDYDGDNKADFVVQRNQAGTGVIYKLLTTNFFSSETFGNGTEMMAPADYDGDNKTDVATVGAVGGNWQWRYRPSAGGADVTDTWGVVSSDFPVVGNYCGTTASDYAVWRTGSVGTFFTLTTAATGHNICQQTWGTTGDLPVGFTYVH